MPSPCVVGECGVKSDGCGASVSCGACGPNEQCHVVTPGRCGPAPCFNGVMDAAEADVDCGRVCAAKCGVGKRCSVSADCDARASCDGTTLRCTAGRYVALAPMPAPAGNVAFASAGSRLYVFGGLDRSIRPRSSVFIFDGQAWRTGASFQEPRQLAGAGALPDGRIALVGGVGAFGSDGGERRRVDVYEPVSDTWSRLPDLPVPRSAGCVIGLGDGTLLLIGGFSGDDDRTPERSGFRLAADSGTWLETPNLLQVARSSAACSLLNDGGVLLAGGAIAGGVYATDTVEQVDPVLLTSTLRAPLPAKRCLLNGPVTADGRIFLLGGWEASNPNFGRSGYATRTSWSWSSTRQVWEPLTDLPELMYGAASAPAPDGGVWIAGGSRKNSTDFYPYPLDTLWRLDL